MKGRAIIGLSRGPSPAPPLLLGQPGLPLGLSRDRNRWILGQLQNRDKTHIMLTSLIFFEKRESALPYQF